MVDYYVVEEPIENDEIGLQKFNFNFFDGDEEDKY